MTFTMPMKIDRRGEKALQHCDVPVAFQSGVLIRQRSGNASVSFLLEVQNSATQQIRRLNNTQ